MHGNLQLISLLTVDQYHTVHIYYFKTVLAKLRTAFLGLKRGFKNMAPDCSSCHNNFDCSKEIIRETFNSRFDRFRTIVKGQRNK